MRKDPPAERVKVLLTGWEGTLSPATAGPQRTPLPVEAVALIADLLAEAMSAVGAVRGRLAIPSNSVPIEQLAPALQRRLLSVYALPVSLGRFQLSSPEGLGADRIARTLMEDWVQGIELFLMRLHADSERLARWIGLRALPQIVSLTAAVSDIHGNEGGVIGIEFAGERIFYKPRSVTGELFWSELNAALAEADPGAAVVAARVLEGGGGGYGWMAALAPGDCEQSEHWRRAGALLCLAQHTRMSDLHMANVIATGRGPAVLDAECLGDPRGGSDGGRHAMRELLETGLLPADQSQAGELLPDVSGLFGAAANVRGVLIPRWSVGLGGVLSVTFAGARLLEQGNRHSDRRPPLACLPELLDGYLRSARALDSIRPDLLRPGGWLDQLDQQHSARIVLRDTLTYGDLMSRSLSLAVIGSEETRRRMLRQALLEEPCDACAGSSSETIEEEAEAMLRLCVPRFRIANGTRDLSRGDGRVVVHAAVSGTPAEGIRRRLQTLRPGDLGDDVKAALGAILFRAHAAQTGPNR